MLKTYHLGMVSGFLQVKKPSTSIHGDLIDCLLGKSHRGSFSGPQHFLFGILRPWGFGGDVQINPRCEPWCWNIYLHLPQTWPSFVDKIFQHHVSHLGILSHLLKMFLI